MAGLRLELPNPSAIEQGILRELVRHLSSLLIKSAPRIRDGVAELVGRAIRNSPEYQSILGGRLWHEFGITDPDATLAGIVETLQRDVMVSIRPLRLSGRDFDGGLTIGILRSDYETLFGLPGVSFYSEGGYPIDWLRWLLTAGNRLIWADYSFSRGHREESRTGYGVMVRGGGWQVPAEYAGQQGDNWLTRTLADIEEPVARVIERSLR